MSITVNTFLPLKLFEMLSVLGSKHSLKDPSFFSIKARLFTQSVGRSSLLIIPDFNNLSKVVVNLGIKLTGTFLAASIVG